MNQKIILALAIIFLSLSLVSALETETKIVEVNGPLISQGVRSLQPGGPQLLFCEYRTRQRLPSDVPEDCPDHTVEGTGGVCLQEFHWRCIYEVPIDPIDDTNEDPTDIEPSNGGSTGTTTYTEYPPAQTISVRTTSPFQNIKNSDNGWRNNEISFKELLSQDHVWVYGVPEESELHTCRYDEICDACENSHSNEAINIFADQQRVAEDLVRKQNTLPEISLEELERKSREYSDLADRYADRLYGNVRELLEGDRELNEIKLSEGSALFTLAKIEVQMERQRNPEDPDFTFAFGIYHGALETSSP